MNKTNNIYIDSLKFGVTEMQAGITFNELHDHLSNKIGWTLETSFLNYLRIWFFTNFFNKDISIVFKYGSTAVINETIKYIGDFDDKRCVMTSEAYKILQDYEKLQQARIDARKAQKLALWAIWISIVLGVVQIVIGYLNK